MNFLFFLISLYFSKNSKQKKTGTIKNAPPFSWPASMFAIMQRSIIIIRPLVSLAHSLSCCARAATSEHYVAQTMRCKDKSVEKLALRYIILHDVKDIL